MNRAVFLDRDGVLNKCFVVDGAPKPPKNINDVEIIVGVKEAVELLLKRSFVIVVVTNQPDVSRGTLDQKTVETINEFLVTSLELSIFLLAIMMIFMVAIVESQNRLCYCGLHKI